MPENNSRALVCLSGGVDSTAALLRCTDRFSEVRAVFVDTAGTGPPSQAVDSCAALDVELVCAAAEDVFKREIRDFTQRAYMEGITPNPCALCNARVKLAVPFSMLQQGELLVTGHYAHFSDDCLCRGKDPSKDQSYFLSLVPVEILRKCFFPLSSSMKIHVRHEVLESGLPFTVKESQDLCFQRVDAGIPGEIVNTSGQVLGMHNGLGSYTPGQRKGLGAHSAKKFVIELDHGSNRLIIGDEDNLYSEICILNNINWIRRPAEAQFRCLVQIRYRKPASASRVVVNSDGKSAAVFFQSPQKALAPGQVGAMFLSNSVIGGGIITRFERDENA